MAIQVSKSVSHDETTYTISGLDQTTLRAGSILLGVAAGPIGRQAYKVFAKVDDAVVQFDPTYSERFMDVSFDPEAHV